MANFNFGHIGEAIQAGKHADANIDTGPIGSATLAMTDHDLSDFVANSDRIFAQGGGSRKFIWGRRWGSSKMRVAE